MIDEYVNKGKVTASAIWACVVALMVAGWAFILVSPHTEIGGMFAATACALSAYAAVMHMRCYMVRLAGLVRATSSLELPDGPSPLRGL